VGRACCCVAFLLFSGPVLFFIGLGLLIASGKDHRTPKIEAYNAAVEQWNSVYEPRFRALTLNYRINRGLLYGFVQTTSTVPLSDYPREGEPAFAVPKPSILFLSSNAFPIQRSSLGSHGEVSVDLESTSNFSKRIHSLTFSPRLLVSGAEDMSCTSSEEQEYGYFGCKRRKCNNKVGAYEWDGNKCIHHQIAVKVCIPILEDHGLIFVGSSKCDFGFDSSYEVYQDDYGFSSYHSYLSATPLIIRSEKDPYVVLSTLTESSFHFGRTRAQNFLDGLILLIVGATVTGLVICGILAAMKACYPKNNFQGVDERSHLQYLASGEPKPPFSNPAPAYPSPEPYVPYPSQAAYPPQSSYSSVPPPVFPERYVPAQAPGQDPQSAPVVHPSRDRGITSPPAYSP